MVYTKAHSVCPFPPPTLQLIAIECHKCPHLYDCMLVAYVPELPFPGVEQDSPSGLTRTPQISEDFVPAQDLPKCSGGKSLDSCSGCKFEPILGQPCTYEGIDSKKL